MAATSTRRGFSSLLILMALAAVAGAALTLVLGAIALRVGPWADGKASSAGCRCDGADRTAGVQASPWQEQQLADQNDELRRAFLTALARDSRCEDVPARGPDLPAPIEQLAENQEGLEMPSPEEVVEQEKAEVASLHGELNQEPVDPSWALATEQATARAVSATRSMNLEEVTCRRSLCRVRVSHHDLAKREDDVEKLLATMPAGGQARVYAPSDDATTVMYFSREGMLLSVMTPRAPSFLPPPPADPGAGESQPPAPVPN